MSDVDADPLGRGVPRDPRRARRPGAIAAPDRVLLIVENDQNFARFLVDLAHDQGFKTLVATKGADALALVQSQRHIDAITLDISLPDHRRLERPRSPQERPRHPSHPGLRHHHRRGDRARLPDGRDRSPAETGQDPGGARAGLRRLARDADARAREPAPDQPGSSTRAHVRALAVRRGSMRTEFEQPAEGLGALDAHAFDCVVLDPGRQPIRDFEAVAEVLRQCATRRIPVACGARGGRSPDAEQERLDRLRGAALPRGAFARPAVDQALLYLHQPIAASPPSTGRASSGSTRPARFWRARRC